MNSLHNEGMDGEFAALSKIMNFSINGGVPRALDVPKAPEAPCVGFYVFWYKIRSFFAIGIYIRSEISHRKINQECMGP